MAPGQVISTMAAPQRSLLGAYGRTNAYTDCYVTEVAGDVALPEFIFSFYTTRLFKLERWILAMAARRPSTDAQAMLLAEARLDHFAAWKVEARSTDEILLAAAATRSWLSVRAKQGGAGATQLMFGSAVVPAHDDGKLDLGFHALLGFHQRYSRWLLKAAAKRVASIRQAS